MRNKATWIICSVAVLLVYAGVVCGSNRGFRFVVGNTKCMVPTLKEGDVMTAEPFDAKLKSIERYQIIVFHSPAYPGKEWVMRVVGLPGEQLDVDTNSLFINGVDAKTLRLPNTLREKPWLTTWLMPSKSTLHW